MAHEPDQGLRGWKAVLASPATIAGAASIITVAITQLVGYLQALQSSTAESLQQIELERLKFQIDIIKTSLSEQKNAEDRASTLLFLAEIGILSGLNQAKLIEWGERAEGIPFFINQSDPSLRPTAAMYREALGEDVYGPDTSTKQPRTALIESVLGPPGEPGGLCPPLVRVELPKPILGSGANPTAITEVWVHEAAAPYFSAAFEGVDRNGIWDEMRRFGGIYHARLLRGSSAPSQHSWGIAVDLDPDGNSIRSGPDQFTMHPLIVTAFKDAGFAWNGDLGRDAMGFVLSTDTLEAIRASGYAPASLRPCPF